MIVDFHNHFYPKAYLDGLKDSGGSAALETGPRGELLLKYAGDYNVVVGGHVSLDDRIRAMAKCGVLEKLPALNQQANHTEGDFQYLSLRKVAAYTAYPDR